MKIIINTNDDNSADISFNDGTSEHFDHIFISQDLGQDISYDIGSMIPKINYNGIKKLIITCNSDRKIPPELEKYERFN